jgi:hypothetical protein
MDQHRRGFLQDSARVGAFALTSPALWRIDPALAQSGSGRELATLSIEDLSHRLANLKITSRQRRTGARGNQRPAGRRLAHLRPGT